MRIKIIFLFLITSALSLLFMGTSFTMIEGYTVLEKDGFTVIKTRADNIKPETIKANLCSDDIRNLDYDGINGGFFNDVYYREPPEGEFLSCSISWSKYDEADGKEVCLRNRSEWDGPHVPWGTLYLYQTDLGHEASVISVKNVDELKEKVGTDKDYIYMIGGGNFYLSDYPKEEDLQKWKEEKYLEEGPLVKENLSLGRTGIGIKKENGIWYVYLAVSGINGIEEPKKLEELRKLFIDLKCNEAIYLDGSGSSQMSYINNDGDLIQKSGDNRYIWSMIRFSR